MVDVFGRGCGWVDRRLDRNHSSFLISGSEQKIENWE
jgi:hypothetical protein